MHNIQLDYWLLLHLEIYWEQELYKKYYRTKKHWHIKCKLVEKETKFYML